MPGAAFFLSQMVNTRPKRILLDFWANLDPYTPLAQVAGYAMQRNFTACHNIAARMLDELGTGHTIEEDNTGDMAQTRDALANLDVVMELQFDTDHSVLLVVSPHTALGVEVLEGWAKGNTANVGDANLFSTSCFDPPGIREMTRDSALEAVNAIRNGGDGLRDGVATFVRCNPGGCGVHKNPFRLTTRFRTLEDLTASRLRIQDDVNQWKDTVLFATYQRSFGDGPADEEAGVDGLNQGQGGTQGLRCAECFTECTARTLIFYWYWHHCADCRKVLCGDCGQQMHRLAGHFYNRDNRRRQCPQGHAMTLI